MGFDPKRIEDVVKLLSLIAFFAALAALIGVSFFNLHEAMR